MSSQPTTTPGENPNIAKFKLNGMTHLERLSQAELDQMIIAANDVYYNDKTALLSDNEYDIIKEHIMSKYPKDTVVLQVGAPAGKNKVRLPYEMWSMDKIKPDTGELPKWMAKYSGPYVVSCKLDGISGLYTTEDAEPNLYSRGDGTFGQDVSHLLSALNLPRTKGIVVRGEFVMPKETFSAKFADKFANPRNMVGGIVNSKTLSVNARDVHFVAYECIVPELKPSEQFARLRELGFKVADNVVQQTLTNEMLSENLLDKRRNYMYEIDGIIVSDDRVYPRASGNPDHTFAFKMLLSDQEAEAKVVDVLWAPSKDGLLKPTVQIEPVHLRGVSISSITGNNARYIVDKRLGVGALIKFIRSGDVIPKITQVVVPAETPQMPTVEYEWDANRVDVVLKDAANDPTVQMKNIVSFFKELDVDGLKEGNVRKIMDAGFGTVPKIMAMTKADFEKCGFKTTAEKFATNIRAKVEVATLVQMMVASGMMGRGIGEGKISPVMEAFPDILTSDDARDVKIGKAKTAKGVEQKSATTFVDNIPKFLAFVKECGLEEKLSQIAPVAAPMTEVINHPLNGKTIVMTKVRDKDIIDKLGRYGATIEDAMKKDVFALIVKTKDDVSAKTKYANEHKIPIMTVDEFKLAYFRDEN